MLRVRTQNMNVKRSSVEIISLDQFCLRGRKLSDKKMTDRELVSRLLAARIPDGTDCEIGFALKGVSFWLEQ